MVPPEESIGDLHGARRARTLAARPQRQSWRQAGVPDVIKATLRELSPRAVERLGELLDSADERIRLEAAKAILDRHLGRPAIQADLTVRGGTSAEHLQALLEVARKRRAEPIDLDERDVLDITPCQSAPK